MITNYNFTKLNDQSFCFTKHNANSYKTADKNFKKKKVIFIAVKSLILTKVLNFVLLL